MSISLRPFQKNDIPIYVHWAKQDHVKNTWFLEGYEAVQKINEKVQGNGYDFPLIIEKDNQPIGYIQYCDLYAYKKCCKNKSGVFLDEPKNTACFDIFIGEKENLNRGYGSKAVQALIHLLFSKGFDRILIDPSLNNKRAIKFYKKLGFKVVGQGHDGVSFVTILELKKGA